MLVPVAERSKAQVYGLSPAVILGSNPTRDMDVCLRRTDHSFREILPTVARRCVWSSNLVREEAKAR